MSDIVKKTQFERLDDFNPSSNFDDPYQEHWIHKQVVVRTGSGEDDWVIEEKPVLTDKVNIFKHIQEEAKNTDLKELLRQFALTGDESVFNKRQGFYGDVSQIQESMESGERLVSAEEIKSSLPVELQKLSVEELAKMTDEDIVNYFDSVRKAQQIVEQEVVKEEK